jgi:hypothetical protein
MPTPTRVDTWHVTAFVEDQPLGVFDNWSGSEADSEEAKYRPGSMDQEISLGGRRTLSNVTIDRYYDIFRDHELCKWLFKKAGQARATLARTPMTTGGVITGTPHWFGGTLKRVKEPDVDSMGNDVGKMELEFTIDSEW